MIKKHASIIILMGLLLTVLLVTILSLSIGYTGASLLDLFETLTGQASPAKELIFFSIRLPRILACLLGGASLALAGLLLQTLTRNPLSDSGILGINTGAGVVIALAIAFGFLDSPAAVHWLPLCAMLGGAVTIGLVYVLALEKGQGVRPVRLIITGVGISTMLSGLMVTIVGNIDRYKMDYIVSWLSGTVSGDDWPTLQAVSIPLLLVWSLAFLRSNSFNLLLLTEQTTIALGVSVKKERLWLLILATILSALSVLLVGNITFVGLVSGHISRRFLGHDHRLLIPATLLIGMIVLLVADTIGRAFLVGAGLPTGLIVSLVGAPYFLLLLRQKK